MKQQNPFTLIKNHSLAISTKLMRNMPHNIRLSFRADHLRFTALLNQIQQDYPNSTIQDILIIAVNRLRHQDPIYREFVRSNKRSKKLYSIQFFLTMDRVAEQYPYVAQEVIRQLRKKVIHNQIEFKESPEILNTALAYYLLNRKTIKEDSKIFRKENNGFGCGHVLKTD